MSVVHLVGVVEDGSARGPYVPLNQRKTIRVYKGSALLVRLAIVRPGGDPVELAGSRLVMTVKKRSWDDESIAAVERSVAGLGRADFLLPGATTRNPDVVPGSFVYDIWWINAFGDAECVLPISALVVEPAVGSFADVDMGSLAVVTAEQILVLAMMDIVVAEVA